MRENGKGRSGVLERFAGLLSSSIHQATFTIKETRDMDNA